MAQKPCMIWSLGPKALKFESLPGPPNYPLRDPSNRDYMALNRGTLGGPGRALEFLKASCSKRLQFQHEASP